METRGQHKITHLDLVESKMLYCHDLTINQLITEIPEIPMVNKKSTVYYNVSCSFDIETSSFLMNDEKQATMYLWAFCLNGFTIYGRTWEEFLHLCDRLQLAYNLNENLILVCYVHNLAYEWGFMAKWFEWVKVFAIDKRKPCYALNTLGIEFRCSYILSGYGLAKLAEQLHNYKIKKLVGDLDYNLLRHSKTPLSKEELNYSENDVLIVAYYIQEKLENGETIITIPPTKTSYVRNLTRNKCLPKKEPWNYRKYRDLMNRLTLTVREYDEAKRAFVGGFTHASSYKVFETWLDVHSMDFTSSYPYCMIAFKYPMGEGEPIHDITQEEFYKSIDKYCCMFDIEIHGLREKFVYENIISRSKCYKQEGIIANNGRVAQADCIALTMTELDFKNFKKFYEYDYFYIRNFRRYEKDYLPTPFVKSILELYRDKTILKGVEGKEREYLSSKELLNAEYGMSVTDINREEEIWLDDHWLSKEEKTTYGIKTKEENIKQYNQSKKRFLSYLWGVWVTAYARNNLFSGILELKEDYIYSDTDSVKFLNYEKHKKYFEWYNEKVEKLLELAMKYHRLDMELVKPKTIKGVEKLLGVWDYEGMYNKFKTLGAKRYMTYKDNKLSITVSGLNKKIAVPYILNQCNDDIDKCFNMFADDLYIPSKYTGKNIHSYLEYEQRGLLTDYLGNKAEYHELSSVHLAPTDYNLGITEEFKMFVGGIHERK